MNQDPDLALIQALQNGDETALNEIIQRHQGALFRFIYRYALNEHDAQDLLQETFVRVYFHRNKFKPHAKFIAWLYRIATNLCRDHARSKHGKQKKLNVILPDQSSGFDSHVPELAIQSNPVTELNSSEQMSLLKKIIDELPHDLKTAFILTTGDNLSHKDCAELLGTTSKAIETRVHRARKILEKKVERFQLQM